jgi:hypothetical protein
VGGKVEFKAVVWRCQHGGRAAEICKSTAQGILLNFNHGTEHGVGNLIQTKHSKGHDKQHAIYLLIFFLFFLQAATVVLLSDSLASLYHQEELS